MIPSTFAEANKVFGPPPDLHESQCLSIPAFIGMVESGSCDGAGIVITGWKPTQQELDELNNGSLVYLCCVGGLLPHYIGTNFNHVKSIS